MLILPIINFFITGLAFLVIVVAVIWNFLESNKDTNAKKTKKSFVETGTMTLFFILFYLSIRLEIGKINISMNTIPGFVISILCWIVILMGAYFNISGRIILGKNWANQIKIYKNHKLISTGVYRIIRHPLYASLIWIFYACSILYTNWLAFLLNTLIFVPMMYVRARQEEKLLSEQFKNYKNYSQEVGMFFPKIKW